MAVIQTLPGHFRLGGELILPLIRKHTCKACEIEFEGPWNSKHCRACAPAAILAYERAYRRIVRARNARKPGAKPVGRPRKIPGVSKL